MNKKFTVIGIGEILWDVFPHNKKLGGATANFAYHISAMGHNGIIVSRIGDDALGKEILDELSSKNLNTDFIQKDKINPTGTVKVIIDKNNQPDYIIKQDVAWDFIEWQDIKNNLYKSVDAICFGTIGQRSAVSRETIQRTVKEFSDFAEVVFDINLRQNYYDAVLINDSLNLATILKLNDHELEIVKNLFQINPKYDNEKSCRILLDKYNLKLISLTLGEEGSMLINEDSTYRGEIIEYKLADRVGAGDAFTAAMTIEFLKGSSLKEISSAANKLASWVTSKEGGMPDYEGNPLI